MPVIGFLFKIITTDVILCMFQIQVLPQGTFVRKNFSPDRVQMYIDGEGKVVKPPAIG